MSDKKLKQPASENKPGAFSMPRTSPKEGIAQPGRFILEQTLIAKKLGISNNAMRMLFLLDRDRKVPTLRSTTDLTTIEMEEYLSKIRTWASMTLSCYIPEPNEVDY